MIFDICIDIRAIVGIFRSYSLQSTAPNPWFKDSLKSAGFQKPEQMLVGLAILFDVEFSW